VDVTQQALPLAGSGSIGTILKRQRESKRMSVAEVSRVTRIPLPTLDALEADRFDDLPGEVFVRGFLKSYAQAVGLPPADVLARYTSSRRVAIVTPLPTQSPVTAARDGSKRLGVAIAFVVLLILVTLALSIVLTPRGHGVPSELSRTAAPSWVLSRV
jgi:cytoskeletal protein RodZ